MELSGSLPSNFFKKKNQKKVPPINFLSFLAFACGSISGLYSQSYSKLHEFIFIEVNTHNNILTVILTEVLHEIFNLIFKLLRNTNV